MRSTIRIEKGRVIRIGIVSGLRQVRIPRATQSPQFSHARHTSLRSSFQVIVSTRRRNRAPSRRFFLYLLLLPSFHSMAPSSPSVVAPLTFFQYFIFCAFLNLQVKCRQFTLISSSLFYIIGVSRQKFIVVIDASVFLFIFLPMYAFWHDNSQLYDNNNSRLLLLFKS